MLPTNHVLWSSPLMMPIWIVLALSTLQSCSIFFLVYLLSARRYKAVSKVCLQSGQYVLFRQPLTDSLFFYQSTVREAPTVYIKEQRVCTKLGKSLKRKENYYSRSIQSVGRQDSVLHDQLGPKASRSACRSLFWSGRRIALRMLRLPSMSHYLWSSKWCHPLH